MCPPDDGLSSPPDDLPPVLVDRSLSLTRAATIKGRDYWLGLRHGRAMPSRSDIVPRDMRDFLAHVGLIERVSLPDGAEDYAVRLAGGRIEDVYGPLSGRPIGATLPSETAARWRLVLNEVSRSRAPLAVSGRMAYANLRHLKYELFIAPLGEGDTATMLFGALDVWPVT